MFLNGRPEPAHKVSLPRSTNKKPNNRLGILRWWRAPFWLLSLATGGKSFADNPILASSRLNRLGLHAGRVKLAHTMAGMRRRRLAAAVPAEWREQFDRDGVVTVPDFLPAAVFDRLCHALLESEFETREQLQGDTVTRRVPVGPDFLREVPDLAALLKSPRWRSLLAYVASTRAQPLYYIQTISTGIAKGAPDPQLQLHSDTFHPSMKAWLYLTDVPAGGAALTYVCGSHRATPERVAWEKERSIAIADADRLSQRGSLRVAADELAGLGLPQPARLAVPANTLVVIDTYGFHARGRSDHPAVRVELWAYSRRSPFLPWTGLDPLSWPPLADRRAQWLASALDWLDARGLRKQHWRNAGLGRPIDP